MPVRSYQVEFSPKAWEQIGSLPWEDFQKLQRALNELAASLGDLLEDFAKRPVTPVPLASPRSLTVGDFIALYEVREEPPAVMLLQVARILPERK